MSKAVLCDRCGKPKMILDDEGFFEFESPDIEVLVAGEQVVSYHDLCDSCSDKLMSGVERVFAGGRPPKISDDTNAPQSAPLAPQPAPEDFDLEAFMRENGLEYLGDIEDFESDGISVIQRDDGGIEFAVEEE